MLNEFGKEDERPVHIRGPVLVPFGWLISLIAVAVSGIGLAFAIGIWVATISIEGKATQAKVARLEDGDLSGRVVRIETILSLVYPEQAEKARRLASPRSED